MAIGSDQVPPALGSVMSRLGAKLQRSLLTMQRQAGKTVGPVLRRSVDLAVASAGLLAASPVLVAAVAAVKLSSPGPVFFRQMRVGQFGRPLIIYKFRTMYLDAEKRLASIQHLNESKGSVTFKIRRDPRITPVGRILRKFSIDELPQLWNLVDGSMTTFGPRPPIPREVQKYGPRERRRLEVKPGLTCLWQVSGRSDLSFEQQVALDLEYIDTSTPLDEAKIFAMTFPAVLTGKGAY